jgi:anti-sigma factor RsiW
VTCREFIDFIIDYVSGDLRPDVSSAFEHHIVDCPDCHRYLTQYQTTVADGRQAFADEGDDVPHDVPEALIQAILRSRQ